MASKENQKLMNKLCDEILTIIQFNTNRDVISGLQQAIDDLQIYKKAFEKSCSVHIHTCIAHDLLSTNEGESGNIIYVEEFENEMLEQARKELENGNR